MGAVFLSMLLGFSLSSLFFIDQNVSAALVNTPANKLKKGDAFHWDLLVVALINLCLSFLGFPWMHGILPHSPMHARALADMKPVPSSNHHQRGASEDYVVVRVRETRVTGIIIHVLILVWTVSLPTTFSFIPVAVLCGLFLYCGLATLRENSLYERFLLLFTQQVCFVLFTKMFFHVANFPLAQRYYPPTNYLRLCPQSTVHYFTMAQLLQLGVICFLGFSPWEYVQLVFPLFIALLIPIR